MNNLINKKIINNLIDLIWFDLIIDLLIYSMKLIKNE